MTSMSAPFGGMPTRWDPESGPSTKVAVIVPGAGYSPSHPLLEFGRQSLINHGWSVQQIWWEQPDDLGNVDARAAWVCDQVRDTLATLEGAQRVLLLGKSLGTLSAPVAAQYGLDAIWLTPLFGYEPGIAAIFDNAAGGARQLLVGGLADTEWDPVRARALDVDVVDFEDVTHFFQVPGDAVRTAQVHVQVCTAIEAFLHSLDTEADRLHNFGYVLDRKLAGMAHPGLGGGLDLALDELRARGFTAVVSLDEAGFVTGGRAAARDGPPPHPGPGLPPADAGSGRRLRRLRHRAARAGWSGRRPLSGRDRADRHDARGIPDLDRDDGRRGDRGGSAAQPALGGVPGPAPVPRAVRRCRWLSPSKPGQDFDKLNHRGQFFLASLASWAACSLAFEA